MSVRFARVFLALVACALALEAAGQADDAVPANVGRVASVQGALHHAPEGDAGSWSAIGLNYPIAQGDNLWADRDARAEVDYGAGEFRLAGDTNVHVSRLTERQLALFIASGSVIVRVRALDPDQSVRIDTRATQIALTRPGLYRIDVDRDDGRTTLTVREGEADIATATRSARVLPGQTAGVADADNAVADIREGGGIDDFDTWSAARDRVYEAPRDNAYVSRQMVGAAELDAYGGWQSYPEYGAVWFPTVDPDWAPYRFGRWTWLPAFGYTWVDDAPWGYAPFHYGRWVFIGSRWGWCPGAFVVRPLWAPALVAWYGGGYASGYGAPLFGWVPLAWGEPFVPWWRGCAARCHARYNRPYGANAALRPNLPHGHYANLNVRGGITTVPVATLASGRPVAINRVPAGSAGSLVLSTMQPAVKPAPSRPGAVRPGNGVPKPAASYASRGLAPVLPRVDERRVADPGAASRPVPVPRRPVAPLPLAPGEATGPSQPPAPRRAAPPVRSETRAIPVPRAEPVPARTLRVEPRAMPAPRIEPVPVPPIVRPPQAPAPAIAPAPPVAPAPPPRAVPQAPARPAATS